MKRILMALTLTALLWSSCDHPVNGVVINKKLTNTDKYTFYTLFVDCEGGIIPCNVSKADYYKYNIGDSVHEKGKYLSTTAD